MAHLRSRLRYLTRRAAAVTTIVAAATVGMALTMLVGMGFQPGWANGWPMGVSKYVVFASFVTIVFAVVCVATSAALFVWLSFFAQQITQRSFVGWLSFFVVLLLMTVCVLLACPYVYSVVHADIVREWR